MSEIIALGSRRPETKLRIGFLRLTDSAPVIVAHEFGWFAEEGIDTELIAEPSWANIADKLAYGFLDAAVILPRLAFAVDLGLRGASQPLLVPCNISLGGNTVTLAQPLAEEIHSESVLRRLLDVPAEVDLVSYSDPGKGCFRYAAIAAGRLLACAFFGPPGWDFSGLRQAKSLLGRDISALDRITLLAGIDTSGETETGKTVCACFSVSEDKICAAIRGQDLKTVAEIGMALQAGTNCGSCIPELKKLLGAPSPVLVA